MQRRFLLACLLGLMVSLPARAMSVLPLYLDEIIAGAAVAFQGKCLENRSERDPQTGFIVTYTTFEVQEVLKGQVGAVHTIKQIGGQLGGETSRTEGVPTFAVGESYVVFLYGVSSAGFSSPVGLGQGQFTILPGPTGLQVTNGRDFKEMLKSIPANKMPQQARVKIQQAPGRLDHLGLDEFKQLVRQQAAK